MNAYPPKLRWTFPLVAVVVGYAVCVGAAARAPAGIDAQHVDVAAVSVGYAGLTLCGIGLVVMVRRAVRWLRRSIVRPGDRALAARWNAAVTSAVMHRTHLVFVESTYPYGWSGTAAKCEPYLSEHGPRGLWFEQRRSVPAGRWMHATGWIARGKYEDAWVLHVDVVLAVFPARTPAVASRQWRVNRRGSEKPRLM